MRSVLAPFGAPAFLSLHALHRWLCRCVALLLLVTVPVYGSAGVLLSVVGPAHRHQQPAPHDAPPAHAHDAHANEDEGRWLQQALRGLIGERAAALLASAQLQASLQQENQPHHHHGLFEHHHHAAGDASVVLLGAGDASAMVDLAAVGSAMLPFLPAGICAVPAPAPQHLAWPSPATARWASASLTPLERPPQA